MVNTMNLILLHGLGQSAAAWDNTIDHLPESISPVRPELSKLAKGDYNKLYMAFCDYCNGFDMPLDLCGLSLGAVLALNYAVDFPEKVRSAILIAGQYKVPKALMKFQGLIFRLMPKKTFSDMGFDKSDFIALNGSMAGLDFTDKMKNMTADVLVAVGERDKPNAKAANEMSGLLDCSLEVIPNSGHEVNVDNPKALAEMIAAFYERSGLI
ncbi:MAG: alpha/beta hydrolase [Oscillospiraceae bacterium]|nr:alpha/beta hydrolase [Oscillospiraceae bacterium]